MGYTLLSRRKVDAWMDGFSRVTQAARQKWCLWWYITRWRGRILNNKKRRKNSQPNTVWPILLFQFFSKSPSSADAIVASWKKMKGHPRQRIASLPRCFLCFRRTRHETCTMTFSLSKMSFQNPCDIQRSKKWLVRGLVKFVPAVAYLLWLALPGSFLNMFCKPFFRAL